MDRSHRRQKPTVPSVNRLEWERRSRLSNLYMLLIIAAVAKLRRIVHAIYRTQLKGTTRLFMGL